MNTFCFPVCNSTGHSSIVENLRQSGYVHHIKCINLVPITYCTNSELGHIHESKINI